jgi:uncharacterized protein YndB with AHSA1/START domain
MSQNSTTADHVYEIVIRSTPDQVWQALTDGEFTQRYYFNTRVESDWQPGSLCRYYDPKGNVSLEGEILEIEPQRSLKTTFKPMWVPQSEGGQLSTLSWEIQALGPVSSVKLTHAGIDDASFQAGRMHLGWVYALSSLKSLLETGEPLPNIFG